MFYWIPVDDSTNFIYIIWRPYVVFNVKKTQKPYFYFF